MTPAKERKPRLPFYLQILIGMAAGLAFGIFLPAWVPHVAWMGDVFIRLLKLIVIPLIFVSIVAGIVRLGEPKKLSGLGFSSVVYYLGTNATAVFISLILVNLIRPGAGVKIFGTAPETATPAFDILNFIPENAAAALSRGDSLQIIFVAILTGIGIMFIQPKAATLSRLFEEGHELLLKITGGLIRLAPLGVFGLLAKMAVDLDPSAYAGIGKFVLTLLLGLVIHGAIALPLIFRLFSGRNLWAYFKAVQPALLSAFSTSSSSATLPVTLECVEKKAGVSKEISGFVLPIGATVNMDGTAMYEATACLFIAQALGMEMGLAQQLIIFFTASLAAIGAAAIPSAGLVTLALVLTAVGLPVEGIGFLLAIDRPLDMCPTVVNVWGDMVGCAVLEGKSGVKEKKGMP